MSTWVAKLKSDVRGRANCCWGSLEESKFAAPNSNQRRACDELGSSGREMETDERHRPAEVGKTHGRRSRPDRWQAAGTRWKAARTLRLHKRRGRAQRRRVEPND